jgi:hypothetical protein
LEFVEYILKSVAALNDTMPHAFHDRRDGVRACRKDLRLFQRALLEGPCKSDATIMRIAFESAGSMACGHRLMLHQGRLAPIEALAKTDALDPMKSFLSIAEGMLKLKFDISRDVIGTGSPFVILKTEGQASTIGLHCVCDTGNEHTGTASMMVRTSAPNAALAFEAITADPLFVAGLPLAIFPLAQEGISLSMRGSIAVLYDGRHCEIVI